MIKLFIKILMLLLVVLVVCNLISSYIIKDEKLFNQFYWRKEPWSVMVYEAIKISKQSSSEIVIVGDSVARNIGNYDHKVTNLSTNYWVSMAGQYIIVNNVIKHNPNIKIIYLLVTPYSLQNDISGFGIYNYFIKPFYTDEYMKLLSNDTINRVRQKPYYFLFNMPLAKVLPIFTAINYNSNDRINSNSISPTSQYYIKKIKQLCDTRNIKFKVFPCPISVSKYQNHKSDLQRLVLDCNEISLHSIMNNYVSNLIVLDDKLFNSDLVHINSNAISDISNVINIKYKLLNYSE